MRNIIRELSRNYILVRPQLSILTIYLQLGKHRERGIPDRGQPAGGQALGDCEEEQEDELWEAQQSHEVKVMFNNGGTTIPCVRYYYKQNIFGIVENKRLVYRFGSKAKNWKPGVPLSGSSPPDRRCYNCLRVLESGATLKVVLARTLFLGD